jgi:hypothetical protein
MNVEVRIEWSRMENSRLEGKMAAGGTGSISSPKDLGSTTKNMKPTIKPTRSAEQRAEDAKIRAMRLRRSGSGPQRQLISKWAEALGQKLSIELTSA